MPFLVMQYMGSMKVFDDHHPSLSLGCNKRLRPLAPKLSETSSLDLRSFTHQVETGGTRWNPTREQIGILEMVYKRGMRTPNTQQIEQITEQLSKYGRIEGKNVFYWFQNHKARERQKQKRHINRGLSLSPTSSFITIDNNNNKETREEETPYKRKCMSWAFDQCLEQEQEQEESTITTISTRWSWLSCKNNEQHTTLELFPLHPEGR